MKLLPRDGHPSIIIFDNGNCASLPYALDNRKSYEGKLLIKDSETIVDTACYKIQKTDYICYVIKNKNDCYEILTCPIREELGDMEKSKLNKIKVTREDICDMHVVGTFISVDENFAVYFMCKSTIKYLNYLFPYLSCNRKMERNFGFSKFL